MNFLKKNWLTGTGAARKFEIIMDWFPFPGICCWIAGNVAFSTSDRTIPNERSKFTTPFEDLIFFKVSVFWSKERAKLLIGIIYSIHTTYFLLEFLQPSLKLINWFHFTSVKNILKFSGLVVVFYHEVGQFI